jgi:hypothetical protein
MHMHMHMHVCAYVRAIMYIYEHGWGGVRVLRGHSIHPFGLSGLSDLGASLALDGLRCHHQQAALEDLHMEAEPLCTLGAQRGLQPAGERCAARVTVAAAAGSGGGGDGRGWQRVLLARWDGASAHFSLEIPLWANGATARRTAARSSARCSAVSVLPLSCPYRGHAGQNGEVPHGTLGLLVLQHGTSSATPWRASACTMRRGCSELFVGAAPSSMPSRALAMLFDTSGSWSFHRPHAQHPISGCLFTAPAAHRACFSTMAPPTHSFWS